MNRVENGQRIGYIRVFVYLFGMEVLLDWIGYQTTGKWIFGHLWVSDMLPERIVHLLWLLAITTPVVYWYVLRQLNYQKQLFETIRDKDNKFASLFTQNTAATVVIETTGRVTRANAAFERMTGFSLNEIQAMSLDQLHAVLGRDPLVDFADKAMVGIVEEFESTVRTKDGASLTIEGKVLPMNKKSEVAGIYLIMQDVTVQRQAQCRMWEIAHYDHLTGLPNRLFFSEKAQACLEAASPDHDKLAVVFIDLDRFKNINDALGHEVGDQVLKIVSERLAQCVPDNSMFARFGGDEFALLIPEVEMVSDVTAVAEHMLVELQRNIPISGYEFLLWASIGIAMYPVSGETSAVLLRSADQAMYEAKRSGKGRYYVHLPSIQENAYSRLRLENDLRRALKQRGEIYVEYQPQVEVETGRVVSAEALVRWKHPHLGVVSPGEFIPICEETGLIEDLGHCVLREVCSQIKQWEGEGKKPVPIGVNVSAVELAQDRFVESFHATLRDFKVSPAQISIEITETTLMKDTEKVREKLKDLKKLGVRIWLDDFGRGYNSLGVLKQVPLDYLKIDRTFVQGMHTDLSDHSIVAALITLAHANKLYAIAEGVECEPQLVGLQQEGCDQYQGFYFSPPIPALAFAQQYI